MAVDLHTHSAASDGSDPPGELVEKAAAAGLTGMALTDHDTLDGIPAAREAADRVGLELIPGVELSLDWAKGGMHMIVLWLAPGPGPLQDRLAELQVSRASRNGLMVERLRDLGMDIHLAEMEAESGTGVAGRPHLAAVMVRKGYVPDAETAFAEYLAAGRPGYVGRARLTPEDAIGLARAGGGVPILAHPHTLGVDNRFEMSELMDRLVAAGLAGIECYYGTYEQPGRNGMVAMARRFGLIPSGGSDYHGTYKPDVMLATGKVGIPVAGDVLEELRAARGASTPG
jgi:3',5'-nucleoside bisphosphate phosphatase